MRVVTCCRHSVGDVLNLIKIWNPNATIHMVDGFSIPKCEVLLFSSASSLLAAKKLISKRKNCVALVFDTPMQCSQLKYALHLDLKVQKLTFRCSYRKLTQRRVNWAMNLGLETHRKIKVQKIDPIDTLINSQMASILNPISTFLYTVRDPVERKKFQRIIYGWLISDKKPKWLINRIMKMGGYTKVPKALDLLTSTIEDKADGPRKAFREMIRLKGEGKSIPFAELSSKYKVAKFDMRYTLSVLQTLRLK